MPSKTLEIVPPFHRQGNGIPSVAIRGPDFGDRSSFGRPFAQIFHHSDTLLLSISPGRRFPSAYAGAGLRRRSSIKLKIFWNKLLDTATSANWNVTYRPWLTTLAPIFTNFSRSVVSDQCSAAPVGGLSGRAGRTGERRRRAGPSRVDRDVAKATGGRQARVSRAVAGVRLRPLKPGAGRAGPIGGPTGGPQRALQGQRRAGRGLGAPGGAVRLRPLRRRGGAAHSCPIGVPPTIEIVLFDSALSFGR